VLLFCNRVVQCFSPIPCSFCNIWPLMVKVILGLAVLLMRGVFAYTPTYPIEWGTRCFCSMPPMPKLCNQKLHVFGKIILCIHFRNFNKQHRILAKCYVKMQHLIAIKRDQVSMKSVKANNNYSRFNEDNQSKVCVYLSNSMQLRL